MTGGFPTPSSEVLGVILSCVIFDFSGVDVCYSTAIPWYLDSTNDQNVFAWAADMRRGIPGNEGMRACYSNNSTGEEDLADLYGSEQNLERLKRLKAAWDPQKVYGYGDFDTPYRWEK